MFATQPTQCPITLINAALREYLDGKAPRFEETLRRIIREELKSSAA